MFRVVIALTVALMFSSYVSDDACAQRGRPSVQPETDGQAVSPPVTGRGGRGQAAMGQAGTQRGPGGAGGGHGHGGGTANPLFTAIDQNQDGQLSLAELRAAAAVMKTLDKDGDGQLSQAECAAAGGGGHGHGGSAADPQADAASTVKSLMEFDQNGDGALTKDELPERMQNVVVRADSDGDEVATQDELMAMTLKEAAPAAAGAGARGRGRFRQSAPMPLSPSDGGDDK
jgi:Ca2+-binding EF-hand superfamily protein